MKSDISHGAIRIEESVIDDAIVLVDCRATHGPCSVRLQPPIVSVHLLGKFLLVEIRVELFHLPDKLFIVDH